MPGSAEPKSAIDYQGCDLGSFAPACSHCWQSRRTHRAADLPALDPAAAAKISFRRDVWPILKRDCWGCHSGANPKGGLNLDSVAKMLAGGDRGRRHSRQAGREPTGVRWSSGEKPEMPKNKPPSSVAKIQVLRHWIWPAALDDSAAGRAEPVVSIPAAYRFPPRVASVALSPDGKLVAAAYRSEVALVATEGETASPADRDRKRSGDLRRVQPRRHDPGRRWGLAGSRMAKFVSSPSADGKTFAARRDRPRHFVSRQLRPRWQGDRRRRHRRRGAYRARRPGRARASSICIATGCSMSPTRPMENFWYPADATRRPRSRWPKPARCCVRPTPRPRSFTRSPPMPSSSCRPAGANRHWL